jgi:hypothetical protein
MSIKGRWSLNKLYIVHKIHHKINSMTLQTIRDCCLNEFRYKKNLNHKVEVVFKIKNIWDHNEVSRKEHHYIVHVVLCLFITYEFWLFLCKIVRSLVILLLPLSTDIVIHVILYMSVFILEITRYTYYTTGHNRI